MVYVSFLGTKMTIHSTRKALMALLLVEQVTVPAKYLDFGNMFLEESANIFPEQNGVDEHAIELEKGKQPPYKPIYSLRPVDLKTFKTYIKTNLSNSFINGLKSLANALILLVRKFNDSFRLCVNYQRLNNLKIKNWYHLSLISESLDWLGQAKQFT